VLGPRAMIEHHLEQRPDSTMSAQYSLPWTAAVALIDDPRSLEPFGDAGRSRDDLRTMAARVAAVQDDALEAAFPAHFAGAVELRLRDGTVLEKRVLDSLGTPARPVDRAAIVAKFRRITRDVLSGASADRLLQATEALPTAHDLTDLSAALGGHCDGGDAACA
jgi:2-methylcitrate dehydratase PrpD